MNEALIDDGGGSVDPEARLGQLEELIDLITNQYILHDLDMGIYTDPMVPWETLVADGGFGGTATEARAYYLESNQASENADGTIVINREGQAFESKTWYEVDGQAWTTVRGQFETVVPLFEQAMSYQHENFIGPIHSMQKTRETLTPNADLTAEDVGKIAELEIGEAEFVGEAGAMFYVDDSWSDASGASENLFEWRGKAAEVFKSTYIDRFPAILVGQTLTASSLETSLTILKDSYNGVRSESTFLLLDAGYIFEAVPYHQDAAAESTDWKTVLNNIAGVAGLVGGIAGVVPGGQAVAAGAALIGGIATVASQVVNSPKHEAAIGNPISLKGDTVLELYTNFEKRLSTYLEEVANTEEVLRTNLDGFSALLSDRSTIALSVSLYGVGDIEVTQWNAFFQPKDMTTGSGLGSITDGSSYDEVISGDLLGSTGQMSVDLNALFLAGTQYIPSMADRYAGLAGKGYTEGLDTAFSRTTHGYNDAVGEYSTTGAGPVFDAWLGVHDIFMEMLSGSATNLDAAAAGLVNGGQVIAREDDTAAAGLNSAYSDYESLG